MTTPALVKAADLATMRAQEGRFGYVYFIADSDSGMVKVGWANSISKRLESLQTGNPRELELHYAIKTVPHAERVLHKVLKPFHVVREWYRLCDEVIDLIDELEIYHCARAVDEVRDGMTKEEIIATIDEGHEKPFLASDIDAVLDKCSQYIDA